MSTVEKVAKFLQSRVTPVSTKYMADYFLMSKKSISRALKELYDESKVTCETKKSTFYWAWNRKASRPLAVPPRTPQLSNTPNYNRPIQNSYPAIRGYDD